MERPAIVTVQPLRRRLRPARVGRAGHPLRHRRPRRPPRLPALARRARGPTAGSAPSGRRVCAVSDKILDKIAPTGPAAVVPNGVDPALCGSRPEAPPHWFAALPGAAAALRRHARLAPRRRGADRRRPRLARGLGGPGRPARPSPTVCAPILAEPERPPARAGVPRGGRRARPRRRRLPPPAPGHPADRSDEPA